MRFTTPPYFIEYSSHDRFDWHWWDEMVQKCFLWRTYVNPSVVDRWLYYSALTNLSALTSSHPHCWNFCVGFNYYCIQSLQLMLCLSMSFALFVCLYNHQWSISASTGILLHVLESLQVILLKWDSDIVLIMLFTVHLKQELCYVSIPSWFTLCYSFLDTEHGQFAMDCSFNLNRSTCFLFRFKPST